MKPTNSPTQGQPNPIKIMLKVALEPLFPTVNILRGLGFYIGNRLQTTRNLTQPKFSAKTLIHIVVRFPPATCQAGYGGGVRPQQILGSFFSSPLAPVPHRSETSPSFVRVLDKLQVILGEGLLPSLARHDRSWEKHKTGGGRPVNKSSTFFRRISGTKYQGMLEKTHMLTKGDASVACNFAFHAKHW